MRNKCFLGLALLATLPPAAQAETNYVFDSLSSIKVRANTTELTGVLVGDTVPTSVSLSLDTGNSIAPMRRCEPVEFALMISEPGVYTLTVTTEVKTNPSAPNLTYIEVQGCTLERKP